MFIFFTVNQLCTNTLKIVKKIAERRFSYFSLQDWKDICTFTLWKSKRPPACSRRWLFSQCEDASTLHCENQNAHRLVADAGYFHNARMQSTLHSEIKKLQVEGQDEDVDDFPSTKVHRRCKMTKSPILLRSKPVVKPFLQWALNGRTDYERQTFISLYCSYY